MSLVASPYGLRPVQLIGGLPFTGAVRSYPMAAQASAIFFGGIVGLSAAGNPVAITATPVGGTVDAQSPIGVMMGAEWEDPIRGFVNSQYLPAGIIAAGAKKVRLKILDSPFTVFQVQANGSVAADKIGENVVLATFGTGNTATGNSTEAVAAATVVAATGALKIIGFVNKAGQSAPGDAFTDLLVIWNAGVHRYAQGAGL